MSLPLTVVAASSVRHPCLAGDPRLVLHSGYLDLTAALLIGRLGIYGAFVRSALGEARSLLGEHELVTRQQNHWRTNLMRSFRSVSSNDWKLLPAV